MSTATAEMIMLTQYDNEMDISEHNPPYRVFLKCLGITGCLVSIVVNIIAITAIIKSRLDKRYLSSILVTSQSFADLLCAMTALMGFVVNNISEQHHSWNTQPFFFIFTGCITLVFIGSLGNTFLIGLERFIATTKPLAYKLIVTRRKVFVCVISMWVALFFLITIPLSIHFAKCDVVHRVFRTLNIRHAHLPGFGQYVIAPLIAVFMAANCGLYLAILLSYRSSLKKIHVTHKEVRSRKLTQTIIAVVLTTLVCWLPMVFYFVFPPGRDEIVGLRPTVYRIAFGLLVVPSYLNAFIYILRQREYRLATLKLFRRSIRVGTHAQHIRTITSGQNLPKHS